MTQEEKDLLLKDLCVRLPYGVKFLRESWNYEWDQELSVVETLEDIDNEGYINHTRVYKVQDIKPYLRSMSSMTEEEKRFLNYTYGVVDIDEDVVDFGEFISKNVPMSVRKLSSLFDWLNAHHFDYRGLIEKGLAVEVTKENNPYKE